MNFSMPDVPQQIPSEIAKRSEGTPAICRLERLLARVVAVEFLVIAGTCYLASLVYFGTILLIWPAMDQYITAALSIALLVLLNALCFKHYACVQAQSRDRFMLSGLGAVALAFSLFLSLLFVFKVADWYSRGTFFFQFGAAAVVILILRGMMHARICRVVQSGAVEARRAVLIGERGNSGDVLDNLRQSGIRLVGIHEYPIEVVGGFSQDLRKFVERCRAFKPEDVIFLARAADLPRISYIAVALSELPVTVHIVPIGAGDLWASSKITNYGGTVAIQVLHPPLSTIDLAIKRAFDLLVAGSALIMLSALMVMVALAIKLDSRGPVFIRQTRHGYNNETIRVFKFRSMTTNENGHQFKQAVRKDPRVTRVGRILRSTNFDELPQLLNVLLGEMSIVGPRPHPIALNEAFVGRISPFSRRHKVKPGITGWAQVNGFRGKTDTLEKMQRRVEYDLYYIDNWSFLLDNKILLMTLFSRRAFTSAV
jgi:Undecaprenyl-phosphate glucose phosphotransferase